jgi:hypothetical protein
MVSVHVLNGGSGTVITVLQPLFKFSITAMAAVVDGFFHSLPFQTSRTSGPAERQSFGSFARTWRLGEGISLNF